MGIEAAILGAGILGAGSSIVGSKRAAGAVSDASDASTAEQRRQFDIMLGLQRPTIDAGNTARDQLMSLLGLSPSGGSYSQYGGGGSNTAGGTTPQFGGGNMQDYIRQVIEARRGGDGRLPDSMRNQFGLDTQGLGGIPGRRPPGPVTDGSFGSSNGAGSSDPLDIIRNTPGYNFQLEQGARALNANRSAGGSSGGELLRDFSRFNQGVASNFYQDYANRLANLAGTGQTASTNAGNAALITGQNIGNNILNAGNARASGIIGQGNAFSGLLGDLGTAAGMGLFGGGGSGGLAPWQSAVPQG